MKRRRDFTGRLAVAAQWVLGTLAAIIGLAWCLMKLFVWLGASVDGAWSGGAVVATIATFATLTIAHDGEWIP